MPRLGSVGAASFLGSGTSTSRTCGSNSARVAADPFRSPLQPDSTRPDRRGSGHRHPGGTPMSYRAASALEHHAPKIRDRFLAVAGERIDPAVWLDAGGMFFVVEHLSLMATIARHD